MSEEIIISNSNEQTVDPTVSRKKFDLETQDFLQSYSRYRKRGIILLGYEFPNIKLAFMAVKINPAPLVFAVEINFTNYDLEAPSVKFINPFLDTPIDITQLPHQFPRKIGQLKNQINLQTLVLSQADKIPFFCIPGVREYHNHPAHTGDSWLLHRGTGGEGTLGFLVEKLYQYGISGINGFQFPGSFQKVTVTFDPQTIPE